MKAKIVGIAISQGRFVDDKTGQVIDFDNIVLHGIADSDKVFAGQAVRMFKLKSAHFPSVAEDIKCPQPVKNPQDLAQLVGHEVRIYEDGKYVDEIYYLK